MLNVTGDYLVTLLGKPESDEGINELLKHFGKPRVTVSDGIDERVIIEPLNVSMMFDYRIISVEQHQQAEAGHIYLNQISFKGDFVNGPFFIKSKDSLEVCIEKIVRSEVNIVEKASVKSIEWLVIDLGDKKIVFIMEFVDENQEEIIDIIIKPFDEKASYSGWRKHSK